MKTGQGVLYITKERGGNEKTMKLNNPVAVLEGSGNNEPQEKEIIRGAKSDKYKKLNKREG